MLVHRRVTPSIKFASTHLYSWVERGTVRIKCLAQEHNTMSPARAWTLNIRSRVERTNHGATVPSTVLEYSIKCKMLDCMGGLLRFIQYIFFFFSYNVSFMTSSWFPKTSIDRKCHLHNIWKSDGFYLPPHLLFVQGEITLTLHTPTHVWHCTVVALYFDPFRCCSI